MTPAELAGVVTTFAVARQPQTALHTADQTTHARFGRARTTVLLARGVVRITNVPIVFDGKACAVLCLNGAAKHYWGPGFLAGVGLIATAIGPMLACCHPA